MWRSIVDIKKEFKGKKVAIIPGFHLGNWALRGNKYSQLQVSDTLRPAVDKQGTYRCLTAAQVVVPDTYVGYDEWRPHWCGKNINGNSTWLSTREG